MALTLDSHCSAPNFLVDLLGKRRNVTIRLAPLRGGEPFPQSLCISFALIGIETGLAIDFTRDCQCPLGLLEEGIDLLR